MSNKALDWAMPLMRLGYAGRGVTYLAIAGLSLWTIWQGGDAKGTSEALKAIETSPFGMAILTVIGAGLIAYTIWRVVDGIADLENEGTDGKGLIARAGQITTGLIHGALGLAALALAYGIDDGSGGSGSGLARAAGMVMEMPGGRWLVALGGVLTIGAGLYYLHKGWTEGYRKTLRANHFTTHWNKVLKAGVIAQGITIGIIGVFFVTAGLTANPNEAGGLDKTFSWLSGQLYGQVLVTAMCLGLLGFALFLFVNAAYRVIPRLSDPDLETLKDALA